MIFACGRCRTRYKISDDSLKGRVLKVRCRSCGAIIAVKDPQVEHAEVTADARESTDWFVALDGKQHGPMTETALVQLLIDGSVTEETYCWNPDLTDWKPLIEVERFERWREHANELVKAAAEAAAAEAASAEAAAAETASAEAAAAEGASEGAAASEADSAVAAETVAPDNNSGAAETTGSEVTSENTPDGVVTTQESTDIIPDEGLPHDEQRVGDSPRPVGVSRSAQSVAATSPSGPVTIDRPLPGDVSSLPDGDASTSEMTGSALSGSAEGEPDDSTMVDLPAITAAMAEAHAAAQSGRDHDATEPDLAAVTEADLDNVPQAQMTGIGDEATPSGSERSDTVVDQVAAPAPTEDQVDSEQLSPRAEKAEEGSGEGLLDDQMELSDANADAATGSVSLVEEGAAEVATSGLECAERSALEPHDDELTPGDVPRESAHDREEPAEAEGVQVDVSSDDASASTLPEGLEELALFGDVGDAESSGLELTPEESVPEASHEDDVSEADPTTDHMEQPPRTPTLESLDALSASLSESPSSSALMGSEGAAAREEERLRLKDLRQEFSVVAELEATRQKRALFAVLIALGLGALVALFIFIDANTERPDVKAEFSGIKTAPGIHRPKYTIVKDEAAAESATPEQASEVSAPPQEPEEAREPTEPTAEATSPASSAKVQGVVKAPKRRVKAKQKDRAMNRYKKMTAKDFAALTSKGGASEFKLPDEKKKKKSTQPKIAKRGGSERAAAISRVIGKKKVLLARCASNVEDKVRVTFTVSATGKVTSIKVSGASSPRKRNCIRGVIKGSIFPKGSKDETFSQSFRI